MSALGTYFTPALKYMYVDILCPSTLGQVHELDGQQTTHGHNHAPAVFALMGIGDRIIVNYKSPAYIVTSYNVHSSFGK